MAYKNFSNNFFERIERKHFSLSVDSLILITSIIFVLFYNLSFFNNVSIIYYPISEHITFIFSLALFIIATSVILLSLACYRKTIKPVLFLLFPLAASTKYFMDTYNIVIDTTMITNVVSTDRKEVFDLLNVKLIINLVIFGLVPAYLVSRVSIKQESLKTAIFSRIKLFGCAVVTIVIVVMIWGQHYASFFREHKILRYYANPATVLYSIGKYTSEKMHNDRVEFRTPIGNDARIPASDKGRELVIIVLGETARADHFSLNGYSRKTNPQLENLDVFNFTNFYSCATSTAISLPCMFSLNGESEFAIDDAENTENLLDVISYADVDVLWRDNNSDSKGVAIGITEEDFRNPDINPVCDIECRDVGMLNGLDEIIQNTARQDIVIILHQMGNHGPAYHKRYPEHFEIFSPVCETSNLEQCSQDEIFNAYDNAILYTDYFLSKVINFLQTYDNDFETAMFYVSDHGESLGEYGLYLHGLPNFMAPDEQRHVPALMWFGERYQIDRAMLANRSTARYTHDNFFHTVLGLLELETSIYLPDEDILNNVRMRRLTKHSAGN